MRKIMFRRLIKERPFIVRWRFADGLDVTLNDLALRGKNDRRFWNWVRSVNSGHSADGKTCVCYSQIAVWRGLNYPLVKCAREGKVR